MNKIKLKEFVLNILSPPRCIACNASMPANNYAMFCYNCSKNYHLNNGTVCQICGKPIYENRDDTCANCKSEKIYYIKNISRYKYKGCIKTAIQNMKFKQREWISYKFGDALAKTVQAEYSDIKFDLVIAVPMSALSELSRGFNQSFEIADIVAKSIHTPLRKNILLKNPGIKTQSGLNRKERAENVKNAFYVRNSKHIIDKTILLIDDVFTTGSTINACAKVLKKNGALAVYAATLSTVTDE